MNAPKYLQISALQTLPYSNVNRDDLGSPKTVMFGGSERTRVSSQSWKRVIRGHIEQRIGDPVVRTRRVIAGVSERLRERGWSRHDADAAGIQVALSAGKGISLEPTRDDRDEEVLTTSVLLLMPESGIDELADIAAEHQQEILAQAQEAEKKKGKSLKNMTTGVLPTDRIDGIIKRRSSVINLLGRMLAEVPGAQVDGAVQMAHAFTTHGTDVEYDFFSAVDDVEQALGLPGSGHIQTQQYSAGTFYRYANINLPDLLENLGGDADLGLAICEAFLEGFIHSVPSGKQTSTAAVTVPDLVHVVVRDDRPVSLANAFEAPVSGNQGHLAESAQRLREHACDVDKLLGAGHVLFSGHAATTQAQLDETAEDGLGRAFASFADLTEGAMEACRGVSTP